MARVDRRGGVLGLTQQSKAALNDRHIQNERWDTAVLGEQWLHAPDTAVVQYSQPAIA